MDDLEKMVEEQALAIVEAQGGVFDLIDEQAKETDSVKTAIDLLATKTALAEKGNIEKIVEEKSEELRNDAEAKRIEAETAKINEEVQRVKAQGERELAELEKKIQAKQKEIEELKAESDKEDAYFLRNKEILKYVNVRSKKTLRIMKGLMFPATIIFMVVQIILFPITLGGLLLENIVNIVGSVCGAIKNNVWKIILSIFVIAIIVCFALAIYYFGVKFAKQY